MTTLSSSISTVHVTNSCVFLKYKPCFTQKPICASELKFLTNFSSQSKVVQEHTIFDFPGLSQISALARLQRPTGPERARHAAGVARQLCLARRGSREPAPDAHSRPNRRDYNTAPFPPLCRPRSLSSSSCSPRSVSRRESPRAAPLRHREFRRPVRHLLSLRPRFTSVYTLSTSHSSSPMHPSSL